jgi:CheY-like chemotaxis protein
MPRRDGREVLQDIKAHPHLQRIPIVVLTTSDDEADIARSYDLGVNSYIRKPATFARLVDIVRTLRKYWFDVVALPPIV